MSTPDLILEGAFDLHAHGSPEFTLTMPGRVSNVEWARLASAARMRGFVMKSHIFPTTGATSITQALFPDLAIVSSITLNPPAGGLSPLAVELAIAAGAKVVWMPTWSAHSDGGHRSIFLERMHRVLPSLDPEFWPQHGLSVVDEYGAVLPEVQEIIRICAAAGAVVASGHLPIAESLALAKRCHALGATFVLTHPLSGSVAATLVLEHAVVDEGGWIEHVFIGCMPMHQRMDPRRIVEAVQAIGPEHCVLATDAIEDWNPPEPEVMRMCIATMLSLGVAEEAVHLMTHDNPASVLGLSHDWVAPGVNGVPPAPAPRGAAEYERV